MTRRRPDPPSYLDTAAKAKWAELLPALPDQEPATLDVFAAYCGAWSRMIAAELEIAKTGVVTRTMSGRKASPHYAVLQAERRAVRQLAAELRLTPKAKRRKGAGDDQILRLIANTR